MIPVFPDPSEKPALVPPRPQPPRKALIEALSRPEFMLYAGCSLAMLMIFGAMALGWVHADSPGTVMVVSIMKMIELEGVHLLSLWQPTRAAWNTDQQEDYAFERLRRSPRYKARHDPATPEEEVEMVHYLQGRGYTVKRGHVPG